MFFFISCPLHYQKLWAKSSYCTQVLPCNIPQCLAIIVWLASVSPRNLEQHHPNTGQMQSPEHIKNRLLSFFFFFCFSSQWQKEVPETLRSWMHLIFRSMRDRNTGVRFKLSEVIYSLQNYPEHPFSGPHNPSLHLSSVMLSAWASWSVSDIQPALHMEITDKAFAALPVL